MCDCVIMRTDRRGPGFVKEDERLCDGLARSGSETKERKNEMSSAGSSSAGPCKGAPSISSHLSYPTTESNASASTSHAPSPLRELLKNRLYVGNLHQTVDECVLIPLCASRWGHT
jgi:hypothetical protein